MDNLSKREIDSVLWFDSKLSGADEHMIHSIFNRYGNVIKVQLYSYPNDRACGFVTFSSPAERDNALDAPSDVISGAKLTLKPADPARSKRYVPPRVRTPPYPRPMSTSTPLRTPSANQDARPSLLDRIPGLLPSRTHVSEEWNPRQVQHNPPSQHKAPRSNGTAENLPNTENELRTKLQEQHRKNHSLLLDIEHLRAKQDALTNEVQKLKEEKYYILQDEERAGFEINRLRKEKDDALQELERIRRIHRREDDLRHKIKQDASEINLLQKQVTRQRDALIADRERIAKMTRELRDAQEALRECQNARKNKEESEVGGAVEIVKGDSHSPKFENLAPSLPERYEIVAPTLAKAFLLLDQLTTEAIQGRGDNRMGSPSRKKRKLDGS